MKAGALNPHTGRDFVQFGKTESVLNKGAEKIALLFNPPPVLSLEIILDELDWELEKRKLKFVRYADDCIIISKKSESCPKSDGLNYKIY